MDISAVRTRCAKRPILEGGLDQQVLARDCAAIREEVKFEVAPLLRDGGYLPPSITMSRRRCRFRTVSVFANVSERARPVDRVACNRGR
ncbi:MAG TPA: hypothetical protein VLN59_11290 [Burkholderiales bacterium]|nr:hypothetical protein [Burkholderiales bacterium]